MTATAAPIRQRKAARCYFKAVGDGTAGRFDAIVAVFNNVDLGGDRILANAFDDSLAAWKASGDPIPVIFSHQWDDLNAHVGTVDPNNVRALLPGDPLLPDDLKNLGGLLIKDAQMELDAPGEAGAFATNLWGKLSRRAIKEFSFAYDIVNARPTKDATELVTLDLIEVGPTLKGMNPATALLGTKALRGLVEGKSPREALDIIDGLIAPPPARSSSSSSATSSAPADGAKRLAGGARPEGSIESTLDEIKASANLWGGLKYGRDLYAVHVEGTNLGTSKAVVTAERWDDPWGEGPVWELSYTLDDKGATITDELELELTVGYSAASAKRRAKALLDAGIDREAIVDQSITGLNAVTEYLDADRDAKAEELARAKAEEPSGASKATATPLGTLLELAELDATN